MLQDNNLGTKQVASKGCSQWAIRNSEERPVSHIGEVDSFSRESNSFSRLLNMWLSWTCSLQGLLYCFNLFWGCSKFKQDRRKNVKRESLHSNTGALPACFSHPQPHWGTSNTALETHQKRTGAGIVSTYRGQKWDWLGVIMTSFCSRHQNRQNNSSQPESLSFDENMKELSDHFISPGFLRPRDGFGPFNRYDYTEHRLSFVSPDTRKLSMLCTIQKW